VEAQNRVVVTGMGVVAPNGIGLDAFWDSLINCKSGIGPITLFDVSDYPLKIAGEIKNFNLRDFFGRDCKPSRLARQTQLALPAFRMAIEDAGLTRDMLNGTDPLPLIVGICSSGADIIEQAKETIMTRGTHRVRPLIGACQPHAISAALVQYLGVQTSVLTISSACPSALDAVTAAAKKIRNGEADLLIVGAADSPINNTGIAGFAAAGIPSLSTDLPPGEISRPFDLKRSGVVISEGAGFFVMERLDSALARGATPYMEIVGGATITDRPGSELMDGMFFTMKAALANAGLYPEQIDYICANATSDPLGDKAETELIKKLFGPRAYQIPISSVRGVTGHPLAPAGMFQMIACALAMKHQLIPPTANLTHPDPKCDLDYVPLEPRKARIGVALANGHGMGAENSTVVMRSMS
jgi:3-oxoacyl-[acyl-carrier-protein] synthase II